ncbi:RNA methyltransferase [Sphingobacteriaceae bacterium AH-315-L07]|nr:class I SAM-dependent RNA methyltransferase [Bacteroidia bacterium]MBN4052279.1 RNA methyltransferase [Sphingobacteriaceae bacterium AH-315-L07]
MKLLAKTLHGLEEVLAEELELLGATDINPLKRAVSFQGNKELLYKCNLQLRTALKILTPIYYFKAYNERSLYNKVEQFDWSKILSVEQTFAIDSVVFSKQFTHSKYVALKVKDAIADQFRKKTGVRPSVDTKNPDVQINVHCANENFTISLDSTGAPLNQRGYRDNQHKAPLNEVLAAGMLKLTNWNKDIPLIDPMCGSGTFLIEAAMMATNTPPGIKRKQYVFMKWEDFDKELWGKIYNEAIESITKSEFRISGSDVSQQAIDISRQALLNFDFNRDIKLVKSNFNDLRPQSENGVLIMNPPYGERLRETDIFALYKMIGDHLKQSYNGFDAWILSANRDALKHVGLRPSKKLTLFNGALECKFQRFSMYKGSLKQKFVDSGIR